MLFGDSAVAGRAVPNTSGCPRSFNAEVITAGVESPMLNDQAGAV
jgi:hypothetical protein